MTGPDPFGVAAVRERVLAAWSASPARFREDANAEEDLSLGGYRDRLVVELAQNAADAAAATGEPGRLRLTLATGPGGSYLAAANTGAPLDAAGVAGLATLRASAKREPAAPGAGPTVGRFGVGFAAVLSVTDEPLLLSRAGGVRFSRADTVQAVVDLDQPALLEELRRRDGHVPVLRLPFETEGEPPQGFSTVVVLPLRDQAATDLARRLLDAVDDALLLALPALAEVEVQVDGLSRTLSDAGSRWDVLARSGELGERERVELYADRPVEEAHRPWWTVLWAVPRSAETPVPQVLHAPTPTDEPLAWPALLLASLPLDPSRRHVAPGPLADRVVAEAAAAYAELLARRVAEGQDVLDLVPTGLGAGAVDGALRLLTLDRLRTAPILRSAEDGRPVRPRDAVVVEGADPTALATLAPYVGGLVDAPPGGRAALRLLGVPALALADVVEAMPAVGEPAEWAERYAALCVVAETPEGREALALLPVPLADGRVVRGARGALLPSTAMEPATVAHLARAGVRLVHPAAAHPLLARLGAVEATARQVLADAAVRELVETSPDADEPSTVVDTVLGLVRAAVAEGDLEPGDLPWLGDLALPDAEGELAPAAALALPGSMAADVFDPDEIGLVAADLADNWGQTLTAVGVLADVGLVRGADVDLADPADRFADLDGFDDWAAEVAGDLTGAVAAELSAVGDLDAVRPAAWSQVVAAIAGRRDTRSALVDPVRVSDLGGRGRDLPPYTAWWLRRELELDAHCDPGGDPLLVALLDPAPAWVAELDHEVRRALGVVRRLDDLTPSAIGLVLDRLADGGRPVPLREAIALWSWLASAPAADRVEPPPRVLARTRDGAGVVPAEDAVVVDAPMWLQRADLGPVVIAPAGLGPALADRLDLDLVSERADGAVTSAGDEEPMPEAVGDLVPEAPARWCRHDRLEVDGEPVGWWVDADGHPHAEDVTGLARALAWSTGHWSARHELAAALTDPALADRLAEDAAFD